MNYQLTSPLAAYPYVQYNDDDNINAFFISSNQINQEYVDYFNTYNLAVYTDAIINGSLLDWVAAGIYGMTRPIFPVGTVVTSGLYNTFVYDTIQYDFFEQTGSSNFFIVNDDIFKRCITWNFYKGDGYTFNIEWLKRRVLRFLNGTNGISPFIDNTYDVSVTFGSGNTVNINIEHTLSVLPIATILQTAVSAQVLQLPFQFDFVVNLL